jgi:Kef-type K+ transport system membrane component KefB
LIDFIAENVFYEIAALLTLAAVVGFIGVLLRQPLIVSFIAVGIVAGPSVLHITQSPDQIHLLAELGIAILLFLVGIKLDVKLVRTLGTVALTTGLGQVAFTAGIGFFICLALGLDAVTSLYVAVALTFSSTIIIVKLLSDKREIDSLHGRIALGFLIVQDIVVVLAMIVLSAIGIAGPGSADGGTADVLRVLLGSALLLAFVLVFIRYVADPLTERMARAPELLVGFAIAMAALFAAIGDAVGFGKELGGLLAGIALASTPYREAIAARLAPLRDFLVLFFFIYLGTQLDLAGLGQNLTASVVLSLFVLIGNPLIVLIIMGVMGYRKRTGFLAGLTVAQISEFSLIFMAMGITLGHVGTDALGLVTLVGLITIAGSVYMITYSHILYHWLEPLLTPFERRGTPAEQGRRAGGRGPLRGHRLRPRPLRHRDRDPARAHRPRGAGRRLQPRLRPGVAGGGAGCRLRRRHGPRVRGHPAARPRQMGDRHHASPRHRRVPRGSQDRAHQRPAGAALPGPHRRHQPPRRRYPDPAEGRRPPRPRTLPGRRRPGRPAPRQRPEARTPGTRGGHGGAEDDGRIRRNRPSLHSHEPSPRRMNWSSGRHRPMREGIIAYGGAAVNRPWGPSADSQVSGSKRPAEPCPRPGAVAPNPSNRAAFGPMDATSRTSGSFAESRVRSSDSRVRSSIPWVFVGSIVGSFVENRPKCAAIRSISNANGASGGTLLPSM